jgi:hypothetical protein
MHVRPSGRGSRPRALPACFPTLLARREQKRGASEEVDLHRVAMRLVRQVQYGFDTDGAVAALLGVIRCYPLSHGTITASEVV